MKKDIISKSASTGGQLGHYSHLGKKVIACTLAAMMFTSTTAFAAFKDVPSNAWYSSDVEAVQSLGIIQGVGNNSFNPNGTLSYAEAITIAAKVHAVKHGKQIPVTTGVWYQGALDYAHANNLLPLDFDKIVQVSATPKGETYYDMPAHRSDVAYYLAYALPENEYTPINTVEMLYDVIEHSYNYDEVIKLYRAGIVSGSGENREFKPMDNITRAETCAIINRLFNIDKRQHFTIGKLNTVEGLSPLPDGSNVGTVTGTVYPKSGDTINGVTVSRDTASGVLGFGNNQRGGIYLGLKMGGSGRIIQVGSEAPSDGYDNVGGYYEQKGLYVFWSDEWGMISGAGLKKLAAEHPTATNGTCADIYGNISKGTIKDADTFFYFDGATESWVWLGNAPKFN